MNENQVGSQEYQNHRVFTEIEEYREFYNTLADGCIQFCPTGAPGILNYASYIYWSLCGTLESISLALHAGQIADAYALVRKYLDDVLIEIYFDVMRKEKFDWMTNSVVEDIDNWIKREQWIPRVERIMTVLKESDSTSELYPLFDWDGELKQYRETLDCAVHTSRFANIMLNCKEVIGYGMLFIERQKHLGDVSGMMRQFFTMHLAFIFHLNSHYLMASDYRDYLECGQTPPEGCERLIAPYAQDAYDKYISSHAQLAEFIKERCSLEIG